MLCLVNVNVYVHVANKLLSIHFLSLRNNKVNHLLQIRMFLSLRNSIN